MRIHIYIYIYIFIVIVILCMRAGQPELGAGRSRFDSVRVRTFDTLSVRFGSVRKCNCPGSMRFGLRFLVASRLGPLRLGLVPRPVPAGSKIKGFGSVRFGRFGSVSNSFLERGSAPKGVGTLRYLLILSENYVVKCPSVQWQPDGLTIRTNKWFLGAGSPGAPPSSLRDASVRLPGEPLAPTARRRASRAHGSYAQSPY